MPPHGLCEYVYMPVHVNRVWMELDPSTIMRFHVCFIFFHVCFKIYWLYAHCRSEQVDIPVAQRMCAYVYRCVNLSHCRREVVTHLVAQIDVEA